MGKTLISICDQLTMPADSQLYCREPADSTGYRIACIKKYEIDSWTPAEIFVGEGQAQKRPPTLRKQEQKAPPPI